MSANVNLQRVIKDSLNSNRAHRNRTYRYNNLKLKEGIAASKAEFNARKNDKIKKTKALIKLYYPRGKDKLTFRYSNRKNYLKYNNFNFGKFNVIFVRSNNKNIGRINANGTNFKLNITTMNINSNNSSPLKPWKIIKVSGDGECGFRAVLAGEYMINIGCVNRKKTAWNISTGKPLNGSNSNSRACLSNVKKHRMGTLNNSRNNKPQKLISLYSWNTGNKTMNYPNKPAGNVVPYNPITKSMLGPISEMFKNQGRHASVDDLLFMGARIGKKVAVVVPPSSGMPKTVMALRENNLPSSAIASLKGGRYPFKAGTNNFGDWIFVMKQGHAHFDLIGPEDAVSC